MVTDGDGVKSTATLTVDVTPTFLLTVLTTGTGAGTVTTSPAGIDCGADCEQTYAMGTVVTLMATPAAGSSFDSFGGDADCSDGTVTLSVATVSCTATFDLGTPQLTVTKSGAGSGTVTSSPAGISCGGDCVGGYAFATVVTLSQAAASGSLFVSYGGHPDCVDGSVTMSASRTCTATFGLGFIDPTLTPATSTIRKIHIEELRERINAVRVARGLATVTFTDPMLTARVTQAKGAHISELRAALAAAYMAAGMTPPAYTDPDISAGPTLIKAVHITELRAAVVALE